LFRIKGLYLAITTLAAQFFLEWCFIRIEWLYNYNDSGAIEVPQRMLAGIAVTGPSATPLARYFVILVIVSLLALIAANVLRGRIGRSWMMIRDMDIAAELMGVRPLMAFSSYYCGVAGALMVFCWLGSAEVEAFDINHSFLVLFMDINHSFLVLFMVIIGGMGSILGCFLGAAFIWALPAVIRSLPSTFGIDMLAATTEHITNIIIGRTWPFPYATS